VIGFMMEKPLEQQEEAASTLPPFVEIDEGYWTSLLKENASLSQRPAPAKSGSTWEESSLAPYNSPDLDPANTLAQDWTLAEATYKNDTTIELPVMSFNSGGLLVSWNTLRGFVPASQLVNFPVDLDDPARRDVLMRRVGQTLNLRIIELDVPGRRLILSERAAQVGPGQRQKVLTHLEAGTTCEATITNLCDFGAFADLGGIEGLIHISELSWGRVNHPRDILSSGQTLKVYIMSVNPESERVALSVKRLQPDPWQSVDNRFQVGQLINVKITNVVDFGAFACIEEGLEGLIHISQLAEGQFLHPRNVVREGEQVQARILNIDGKARRLGLSLRQVHNGSNGDSE
jgi:small subunit ribosomal protein S1